MTDRRMQLDQRALVELQKRVNLLEHEVRRLMMADCQEQENQALQELGQLLNLRWNYGAEAWEEKPGV